MTVTAQGSRSILLGNGVTTTFSANFELPAAGDLFVWRQDTDSSTTALSNNLYALGGVGSETGFTITYPLSLTPLTTGQSLICIRDVPYTQPTQLSGQGPYDPTVVMDALDNLEFQIQQLVTAQGLSIMVPYTDPALLPLPNVADRANSFLFFDGSGDPTTASATSGLPSSIYVAQTSSAAFLATEIIFTGSGLTSVTDAAGVATVTVSGGGGGTPGGTNGQIQFNNTGSFGGLTVSGDGTLSTAGALVVTKTNGTAFASLATLAAGGDLTGATNSTTLTLKTVNSNVGTFAQANVTVNGKGLVTAISTGSTGASITITDGTHTASGVTTVSFTGATVTTATPTGSVTITGGGAGGMTFIAVATANNSATSLTFTNCFTSTYDDYIIRVSGLISATAGANVQFQFAVSGTPNASSNYFWFNNLVDNAGTVTNPTGASDTVMHLVHGVGTDISQATDATINISGPLSTANLKNVYGLVIARIQSGNHTQQGNFGGMLNVTGTAFDGFSISSNSGNLVSGSVRVYGLQKS